ncbi:MAG TPA: DUF533 domain-containing protein [Quisquiliibacterium sp.]|nr:DUF533 domain-containing protein [Quisquiliibacterium sp.]
MNEIEQKAVLAIVILAAFADGAKEEAEREEVRRVAQALGADGAMQAALTEVLLKRTSPATAAAQLQRPELRQLAYELAVGVCEADGLRNADETRFLAELEQALGVGGEQAAATVETADALATLPLEPGPLSSDAAPPSGAPGPSAPPSAATPRDVVAATPRRPVEEIDATILNYAILNGALELLPQSTASMAIIPLQMKMVYRIGKDYGYELDRGHVRDLLAAMGVGLTGQYLEEIGRKLVGGLFGKAAGRMLGGLARGATGIAFSFATTWALGQVARRYYAGGRVMSAQVLKDTYAQTLGQAKTLQSTYLPQIEQKARTLDVGQVVQMARSL